MRERSSIKAQVPLYGSMLGSIGRRAERYRDMKQLGLPMEGQSWLAGLPLKGPKDGPEAVTIATSRLSRENGGEWR
jgi:hypothetical protein